MISSDPWVWVAAILTICSFSLLYGDNKLFRFSEYTFIAVVVGHSVVTGLQTFQGNFKLLFTGENLSLIIPFILGIMVLFVAYRKYAWIATIPYAVMIGINTGLVMRATITTNIVGTIRSTIAETGKIFIGPPTSQLGYLIRVIFTIGALFYFLFTVFYQGTGSNFVGYLRTFGKYTLLIFLGLSLGNSAMQSSGLATSALNRLLRQWLGFG
jgi:hypothetical protein